MTCVYLAEMVELLATFACVLYVEGNATMTSPLLEIIAPVLSCFVSSLKQAVVRPYCKFARCNVGCRLSFAAVHFIVI